MLFGWFLPRPPLYCGCLRNTGVGMGIVFMSDKLGSPHEAKTTLVTQKGLGLRVYVHVFFKVWAGAKSLAARAAEKGPEVLVHVEVGVV